LLALQSSQRTYLHAAHRVHARRAVLDPPRGGGLSGIL
jgi:hypothetical protein